MDATRQTVICRIATYLRTPPDSPAVDGATPWLFQPGTRGHAACSYSASAASRVATDGREPLGADRAIFQTTVVRTGSQEDPSLPGGKVDGAACLARRPAGKLTAGPVPAEHSGGGCAHC